MSMAMRGGRWLGAQVLACSLLVACGDDDGSDNPGPADGAVSDAARPDGATPAMDGATPTVDAGVDAATPPADASKSFSPKVVAAQISAVGNDRFYSVTHDSAGNIFAVGETASVLGASADKAFVVAKYSKDGVLDTSFGSSGYAIKNVVEGAGAVEGGRAIVILADGKILAAGNAEHAKYAADAGAGPVANDADLFLVRFNANGSVDTTFGTDGVARVDVGTGVVTTPTLADGGVGSATLSGADNMWSLSATSNGKFVIHTSTIGTGPSLDGGVRTDTDFALVRLNADGTLDTSFGSTGIVRTDFANTSASVRSATVLADNTIVGAGYSTNRVLGTESQNPVIYKVKADGTPDSTFGVGSGISTPGVWFNYARPDQKRGEAYGATLQGNKFVTFGYGQPAGNTFGTDLVWFRFNADGSQDKTFGTDGVTTQDLGGYGDNGRGMALLPDSKVIGVGSGRLKPAVAPEAGKEGDVPNEGLIAVIQPNGAPDTAFGTNGLQSVDLGGTSDTFYGVSVSTDKSSVAAVGWGAKAAATDDEDGVVVIFPVP